jgi:signal transduction histidine kinase
MGIGSSHASRMTSIGEERDDASSTSSRSDTEVRHRFDRVSQMARGPIVATAVVVAAYLLTRTSFPVRDLDPIYLVVVVGIAAIDGSRSALASGLILVAYVAYADSSSGHLFTYTRESLFHLGIFTAATLACAVVAGGPARNAARLRGELLAQGERLSEALVAKREFMNAAAHQLRTPLTVIAGYISMLQDETFGRLPERFRDPMSAMQRKAREVGALIDEMLLAARVQRGTLPTASMPVDVRDAVRKAVDRAEPRVTLEQATLSFELPSSTVAADVDPDQLGHILDNLISNALTYTDGRPWVKVTVTGGSDVRVLVKDRGWGVPEVMRQKIFEGFVRDVNPEHKPKSGRGLGLSISREMAEHYGGSLNVIRTAPGKGSIFVLRLPAAS